MEHSQHPAFSPERDAFRKRFNVRPITESEEGVPAGRLPEGVYGFTSAAATPELPLFRLPTYRSFEIHKIAGGAVCYAGYVTEAEHHQFLRGAEPMALVLYPEPAGDSTHLISVPIARMDRTRPPARDAGYSMAVEVAPKPEYLGLSGAMN